MTISHKPINEEDRETKNVAEEQREEIIKQLKIINMYLSMGFDEVIKEEDLN